MGGARGLRNIGLDVHFGLLASSLESLLDKRFDVSRMSTPDTKTSRPSAVDLVIADFGPAISEIDVRLNQLLGYARTGQLLIIMLTRWDDVAIRLIRAGAAGVLFPDADAPELQHALEAITERRTYLPPSLQETLVQRFVAGADATLDHLTRRELEFVCRLAIGASTSEIAEELGLSSKTADTHRANLLRKLGLRNNVEVARLALQHGLVTL